MIENLNEIADIFNCFHDADLSSAEIDNNILKMNIEYSLKDRNPKFNYSFTIKLFECKNITFETWPRKLNEHPRIIKDVIEIFSNSHWILEGNIEDLKLNIVCSQTNNELDYSGGTISMQTRGARIFEQNGKELTLDELYYETSQCWNAMGGD